MEPPTGSTDPIGAVLAWIPVGLAVLAMLMGFFTAGIVLVLEAMARRHRVPVLEPQPSAA
jgi:hypothetical protein